MSKYSSSWKKFQILGPATIVSVAYIDPGNFGSNIEAGASFGLSLLWVVWLSSLMAILFQYLSGKLGMAYKKSLLEYVDERLKGLIRHSYFASTIAVVFATDMAEFLGIALGLSFLLQIPLIYAIPIAIIDVFILLFAADKKRTFELLIGSLVAIVGISYLIELYIVKANISEIIINSFLPKFLGAEEALVAISIIGATIMPHAVILHSYLTKENSNIDLNRHRNETIINLIIATLINVSIQVLAYYSYFGKEEEVDMHKAYYTLIPLYGINAAIIFAIALLASGISSSLVSVITGQKVFETAFRRKFVAWKLRAIIRIINMMPLAIAILMGLKPIEILIYSQAILSLVLPIILFTLVFATNNKRIMNEFANNKISGFIALLSSIVILFFNFTFIILNLF